MPHLIVHEIRIDSPECTVIQLSGVAECTSLKSLESKLLTVLIRGDYFIILDLSNLIFISHEGIEILYRAIRHAERRHGRVIVFRPTPLVRRIMARSGLSEFVDITDSLDEALTLLRPSLATNDWSYLI